MKLNNERLAPPKDMSIKLLQIQESERKRIALELHDSIGQQIHAIKLDVENTLSESIKDLPISVQAKLKNITNRLTDVSNDIRNISMNLRPSMLDDLGLEATIRWFVRKFSRILPVVKIKVIIDIEEHEIPESYKLSVFRIIQESLNNIAKHAKAQKVEINLELNAGVLRLSIIDDGKGFDVGSVAKRKGIGLGGMKERVTLGFGEFYLESKPEKGTKIEAHWHLTQFALQP